MGTPPSSKFGTPSCDSWDSLVIGLIQDMQPGTPRCQPHEMPWFGVLPVEPPVDKNLTI